MVRPWLTLLATTLAAVGTARGAEEAVPPEAPVEAGKVVVEAASCAAFGPVEPLMLRKILKWRRGDLWLPSGGRCVAKLTISRVVSGELRPDETKAQQGGLMSIKVYVINDAALALASPGADGAGTWRLARIRRGGLIVSEAGDTPFAPDLVRDQRAALRSAARNLTSDDAAVRLAALTELGRSCPLDAVPAIIDLCWDQGYVISPEAKDTKGARPLRPEDIKVVGEKARRVLSAVTKPLSHHGAPKFADGREAFRAWWKDLTTVDTSGESKLEIRLR